MTLYTRGFSHFVTSMTAPVASGWSDSCRVGLAPTEERRLSTAHTQIGHSRVSFANCHEFKSRDPGALVIRPIECPELAVEFG